MADFIVIKRNDLGRETWDAFTHSSDEAWLWHLYDLQDALATWPHYRDRSVAFLDPDSGMRCLAILPLHLIPCIRLTSLGGPACDNSLAPKQKRKCLIFIRDYLIELAARHSVPSISVILSPMAPAYRGQRCPRVNPLLDCGFENTLGQTWVVDLRPGTDTIWQRMEGRARTAIRKANSAQTRIRAANLNTDLDVYYSLHCETYQRTDVAPHPRSYFEMIWEKFYARGLACIFFAEHDGEVVVADNFGVYKNSAIYWTGASTSEGLALNAGSLIHWTAIQWMVERELQYYETGEAFPNLSDGKLKGLNDFKRSFGGELYPYYKGSIDVQQLLRGKMSANRLFFQRLLDLSPRKIINRVEGVFRSYRGRLNQNNE